MLERGFEVEVVPGTVMGDLLRVICVLVVAIVLRGRDVDIAPTFIRHAQDTEATDPLGIAFQVADGMALPFAEDAFDFVTVFMSLMDMPDQARVLREAHGC